MDQAPPSFTSTTVIASTITTGATLATMDADCTNVKINWDEVEKQAQGHDPYLMPLARALLAARADGRHQ